MNDQMKQRLEDRIKVTNTPELQVLLCDCRTLIEELEGEVKSWAEQAEQYRVLIPTTAQAMAYQSLLNKYNQLEQQLLERDAALAQMREALEKNRGTKMDVRAVDQALSTNAGKAMLERLEVAESAQRYKAVIEKAIRSGQCSKLIEGHLKQALHPKPEPKASQ